MKRSRLKSGLERQAKQNILLTFVGLILIGILIVIFGIPAIVNLSLFVGGAKSDQDVSLEETSDIFVAPPMLDSLPKATSQDKVTISGYAQEDQKVKIYINTELVEQTTTKDDGQFSVSDVSLEEGENSITAIAVNAKDKHSKESEPLVIWYLKEPPELSIDQPTDGQTFSGGDNKNIEIRGKTAPDVKVTINDFRAIVDDEGAYRYRLTLKDGENQLKIVATDEAGNKTEKEIKVTYNP